MEDCNTLPDNEVINGVLKCRTKLLHKFLPPIDVELTIEFGGSDDQRILVISVRCLAAALALMVVDHKGRIVHATTQLGVLLGYNITTLQEMTLAQVIPPPYSQLHASWTKVRTTPPRMRMGLH